MVHDRAAFGGVVVAIGLLYLWFIEFPLRDRAAWSWWTILSSGMIGFGSFLSYVGYGYLDEWHGAATLALLPFFVVGAVRTHRRLRTLQQFRPPSRPAFGFGRSCLLVATLGAAGAGLVILVIGMTAVFVTQDLDYLGTSVEECVCLMRDLFP